MAGRVTTWTSHGDPPKHHLDPGCDGLAHVSWRPDERSWPSHLAVLRDGDGRPCRRCALEPSLVAAAAGRWAWQGPRCAVTFSGQGSPGERYHHLVGPYQWAGVSETGAARLVRVAALLGLDVVDTDAGPVAHGTATRRWARLLAGNLRCYDLGDVLLGDREAVATFWTMACTHPLEQHPSPGAPGLAAVARAVWS